VIEVKNYFQNQDKNSNIVATINFYIPEWGLYLNKCKFIRKKNGGFFIGFPSEKKEGVGEEVKYFPYFFFDKDKADRFQSAAQKAVDKWIKDNVYE